MVKQHFYIGLIHIAVLVYVAVYGIIDIYIGYLRRATTVLLCGDIICTLRKFAYRKGLLGIACVYIAFKTVFSASVGRILDRLLTQPAKLYAPLSA